MTDQSVSLERLVFYDWQKNSLLDSDDDFHWGYQLPLHVPTTVLTTGLFKIDNCAWLCYKLNVLASLKYWISNGAQNPNRTRLVLCVVNFMVYLCENKNNSKLLKNKQTKKKKTTSTLRRPSAFFPKSVWWAVHQLQLSFISWYQLFKERTVCICFADRPSDGWTNGIYPVDCIFCTVVEIAWFMVYTCTVSFTDVVQGHRKYKGTVKL